MQRIADRIEKPLAGELNIEQELKAAPLNNLKKSEEAFTVASRVIVNNNASSSDTVIEVHGRDRVGLLYDVTAALTRLGLKISSAHITTFGEEVVDTFYIKDAFGLKISHKEKIQKIIGSSLKMTFMFSLIIMFVVIISSGSIVAILSEASLLKSVIIIFSITIPFNALTSVAAFATQGFKRLKYKYWLLSFSTQLCY